MTNDTAPLTLRYHIYEAIETERAHQDRKYGSPQQRGLTLTQYQEIAFSELTESIKSIYPYDLELHRKLEWIANALIERNKVIARGNTPPYQDLDNARCELLQVAAVAIAALEAHGLIERTDLPNNTGA